MEQTDLAGEQMIETIFIPKSVMPLDGPKELIHWRNNRTGEPFLLKVDAWYAKKNKLFLHIGKK